MPPGLDFFDALARDSGMLISRALRDIREKEKEKGRARTFSQLTDCVCACVAARGLRVVQYVQYVQYRPYHIYTQRRPTTDDAEEARAFLYPQRLFLSILASLARRATNHCD